MVMTVSWCKGVNLWSFAGCQHRGVLAEDFEDAGNSSAVMTKGCLLMLDLIFSVVSIGSGSASTATVGAREPDQREAIARHNMSDAKLRSYATRSATTPRSPISISATPVSPICGASRQN